MSRKIRQFDTTTTKSAPLPCHYFANMSSSGSVTISYTTLAELALAAALIGGVSYVFNSKQSTTTTSPHSATPSISNKKKKQAKRSPGVQGSLEEVKDNVEHVATRVQEKVQQQVQNNPQVKQAVKQASQVAQQAKEVVQVGVQKVQESIPVVIQEQITTTGSKNKKKKNNNKGGNKTPPPQEKKDNDDMRDYEVEPQVKPARVMEIVGGKIGASSDKEKNAGKEGEGEWEKLEDEEEGGEWESVVSKSNTPTSLFLLFLNSEIDFVFLRESD